MSYIQRRHPSSKLRKLTFLFSCKKKKKLLKAKTQDRTWWIGKLRWLSTHNILCVATMYSCTCRADACACWPSYADVVISSHIKPEAFIMGTGLGLSLIMSVASVAIFSYSSIILWLLGKSVVENLGWKPSFLNAIARPYRFNVLSCCMPRDEYRLS